MPELMAHVRDWRTGLEQQRRVGVPQIVDTDLPQARVFQQPAERVSQVTVLEWCAGQGGNTQAGIGWPFLNQRIRWTRRHVCRAMTSCGVRSTLRGWCDFGEVIGPRTRLCCTVGNRPFQSISPNWSASSYHAEAPIRDNPARAGTSRLQSCDFKRNSC